MKYAPTAPRFKPVILSQSNWPTTKLERPTAGPERVSGESGRAIMYRSIGGNARHARAIGHVWIANAFVSLLRNRPHVPGYGTDLRGYTPNQPRIVWADTGVAAVFFNSEEFVSPAGRHFLKGRKCEQQRW
jgi:hypothetical protein